MAAGDVTLKHGASVEIDIDPEGLASSSSRTAGVESGAVVVAAPAVDHLITGKIRTGTSPTAGKQIDIWVAAPVEDGGGTPVWPDVLDGTKSAETLTSENVRNAGLKLAQSIQVDNTSDRTYPVQFELARLFGGVIPERYVLFITHDTGVALHATGTDHKFWYKPVYANVSA